MERGGVLTADHYGNYVSVWSEEHHDSSGTPSTNIRLFVSCREGSTDSIVFIDTSVHLWFTYQPYDYWCPPGFHPVDALVGAQ